MFMVEEYTHSILSPWITIPIWWIPKSLSILGTICTLWKSFLKQHHVLAIYLFIFFIRTITLLWIYLKQNTVCYTSRNLWDFISWCTGAWRDLQWSALDLYSKDLHAEILEVGSGLDNPKKCSSSEEGRFGHSSLSGMLHMISFNPVHQPVLF